MLAWDHIDSGLDKEWLWQDWLEALDETEVDDCRWTPCFDCGVCPQMGTEHRDRPHRQDPAAPHRARFRPPGARRAHARLNLGLSHSGRATPHWPGAAEREAGTTNSSADDVARGWLTNLKNGAQEMSPELKSSTCAAVTDVLADALDHDGATDVEPVKSAVEALRDANPTAGTRSLISELETGLTEVADNNPVPIGLFLAKAGACEAVAP